MDGIFGPKAHAAADTFQRSKSLGVDGIVGPLTWGALIIQVSQGSRGDAVKGVQEEFQFRNLSGDPSQGVQVDGVFGPMTIAAVRAAKSRRSISGGILPIRLRRRAGGVTPEL